MTTAYLATASRPMDSTRHGAPIVRCDMHSGNYNLLAFLHNSVWEKYGYTLDGSFGAALDEVGERCFSSWDGGRRGQTRG